MVVAGRSKYFRIFEFNAMEDLNLMSRCNISNKLIFTNNVAKRKLLDCPLTMHNKSTGNARL